MTAVVPPRDAAGVPDVRALRRARPRSRLLRASAALLALVVAASWASGDLDVGDLVAGRRFTNAARFLEAELVPYPLRGRPLELEGLASWARGVLTDPERAPVRSAVATLAISVLAIGLAGLAGALLAPFAARNLAAADPFAWRAGASPAEARSGAPSARPGAGWRALTALVRAFLILLRAIPEYVWAFLLLAMLGPSAWPAVLALAIHNAGILGRLGAESIENLDAAAPRALRIAGAGRAQIAFAAVLPAALSRFLLYLFYRFETCVREATVLGMLGVVSLGYWIQDARSRQYYDELAILVALGGAIVLVGDVVSAIARAVLRRAS